jgi:hypothetical protein
MLHFRRRRRSAAIAGIEHDRCSKCARRDQQINDAEEEAVQGTASSQVHKVLDAAQHVEDAKYLHKSCESLTAICCTQNLGRLKAKTHHLDNVHNLEQGAALILRHSLGNLLCCKRCAETDLIVIR